MKINELNEMVDRFDKTCVLVLGDLMLDKFIYGIVTRISPEAPVPVVDVISEIYRPGGAANAIGNIRALGGKVIAIGVIGDDWYGRKLIELLNKDTVDTKFVIVSKDRPTTLKTRIIAGGQHIVRIDMEGRNAVGHEITEKILDYLNKIIDYIDVILISDYDKGVITNELLEGVILLGKKNLKPVVAYPKVEHFLDYKGVTIVITNLERASSFTGISQINETSIRNMGQWLLTHLECDCILITQGKEGMSLFDKNGSVIHIPSISKEVKDETGAGDTVSSLFALSLATGAPDWDNSSILANMAAGIVIEKYGNRFVTKEELKDRILRSDLV